MNSQPQNILVDEFCTQVILIDFGIASELSQEATEARLPEVLEGTLAYVSPEQTGRTARGLDARTDLYSLGVTLFEMLAGRLPFLEKDALALVYAHLAKAPPVLEKLMPEVPIPVSQIVERCLQKALEKRYQTAKGLAADLGRCLQLLQAPGPSEPFALGQKDYSPKLQIAQTLISREAESKVVTAAFERTAQGAVELLLLGGPSGIGKTALVRAVYQDIAKVGRGLLLSGKHDQLGRAVPYAALGQAVSGLMRTLAASPRPVFEAWRERLDRALGPLARIIADQAPELEWLIGPLPALPAVSPDMAYNRLKLAWIDFVRTVTDASPPLVLFLDDMQWIDPASLELVKTLLTDVGRKHLLLIAAYRDNEVQSDHPLWKLVEAAEKSGVPAPRLRVGPLSAADVHKWLVTTLSGDPEWVRPLSASLYRKTQGNPFFLGQLLLDLYRRKRLRRNLEDGSWEWEQEAVERADVTDNVVELMLRQVEELPPKTQELLGQAACSGYNFSLGELASLAGLGRSLVVEALRPALQAELVAPSDGHYREAQALAQSLHGGEIEANYRFLHDRVQQACYERIAPAQRAKTHLQIGRRLEKVYAEQSGSKQKLLELVRHLNLGCQAMEGAAERQELARLNLQAAKAAKETGSYRLQATLAEQAQELLGAQARQEAPQLLLELELERIEAACMLREFADVHRRAEALLALPLPALQRLAAQELQVRAYYVSGQFAEGERLGLLALEEQGICYPESSEACLAAMLEGIRACDVWLDTHPEGFRNMPADLSPWRQLFDVLHALTLMCVGTGSRRALAALGYVRSVQRTTEEFVLSPAAPYFLGLLANGRSAFLGDYRRDVRWVQEGLDAAERLGSPYFSECCFIRGYYGAFVEPVEETRKYYQTALRAARASGSFQVTGFIILHELCQLDLWAGRPLEYIASREASQRDLMIQAGNVFGQHGFALAASYAAFLRTPSSFHDVSGPEWLTHHSRTFLALGNSAVATEARTHEAHLFLAFGEFAQALERAEEAERFRADIYGLPTVTDIPLWRGLAAAKCCVSTLSQERRTALLSILEHALDRFRYFSEGCAENFLHKLRLLEAEQARLHGRADEAMAKYEEAIVLARNERFLQIEGLAAHFYAEFHLAAGRERIAALYLHHARDAYFRWDALALVSFLEQKYPALLLNAHLSGLTPATTRTHSSTITTHTTGDVIIDVNTTVRAAQALSSELEPQRVVTELMRLVQENAGAQRAALLITAENTVLVAALLFDSQVHAGQASPLSDSHPISQSVVRYVLNSREALVVSDASTDSRFAQDLHLRASSVRSVLAVPLIHQGRLGGVLYLEHEAANAFPAERVHLLGVLAAQSAIALENARLYAELQAANTGLEAKVAERTAALEKALQELWSEMDLAQKIQTVLLPGETRISGYDFAAVMRPTSQVGGDYYDVFRRGNQDWVLIGDVSGHGVPAGLCMMMIQTALRTAALTLERAEQPLVPSRLLSLVNEAVENNLKQIGQNQYMTITALCIEEGRVRYAGLHQDLLIYRAASQKLECIETQGIWLGVVEGALSELLEDNELELREGDALLLYTDGYTEAKLAGRLLGTKALAERFTALCEKAQPSAAVIEGLLDTINPAKVEDDVTLVVLRRTADR